MLKNKAWYIKFTAWEFWPMWVLYVPVFVQHFWLSAKAKNLFFFLKTNPAINEGFILSDSKYNTLQLVPNDKLPTTIFIKKGSSVLKVTEEMRQKSLDFPVILKPDIGFRGLGVQKIDNENQLTQALKHLKVDYLIQEYVGYPIEIGIFYYRIPSEEKGHIPSITLKEFLTITGDGTSTFEELIDKNPRAILQKEKLKRNFPQLFSTVIPNGESHVVEVIGNHNRGTKFINANNLFDERLLSVFDALNREMPGFYFGRFDIKAKSIEDLKLGINFKILEVNGVGAEPTHVYDPDYKLMKAWKEMLFLWRVIYRISIENKKAGEKFPKYNEAKRRWDFYRNYKKTAFAV